MASTHQVAEHRELWRTDDQTHKVDGLGESYLEIEEGKSFRIKFRCIRSTIPQPDFQVHVELDGRRARGAVWLRHRVEDSVESMYIQEDGETKKAEMTFATLPKTDEDHLATVRGQAVDRLCKINITLSQGKYTRKISSFGKRKSKDVTASTVGMVHEKQLKLGSTITAANAKPPTPTTSYTFASAPRDSHVCRFVWNYHTRTQLSLMGIVEDQPPPAPILAIQAPVHSDVSISAAPVDRPVKRESGRLDDGALEIVKRVKRERTGTGSENKPILVSEDQPIRRSSRGSGVKAEPIDLTDD